MSTRPREVLSLFDAVALTVGIVVGAGIFKTPALVAAQTDSALLVIAVWLVGGLVSLIGALCYAELVTSHPDPGGEYHILSRAYGAGTGFLFAWTRLLVVQTGSIALLGFVFGDYANDLLPLGAAGPAAYAAAAVVVFSAVNIIGWYSSSRTQRVLATVTVGGLILLVVAALLLHDGNADTSVAVTDSAPSSSALGLMMVFVLLTYGGWNEAAYISAEVRDGRRNLVRALTLSIAMVTALYLVLNYIHLRVLGLEAMSASEVPISDLMRRLIGSSGATLVSGLIAVVVLASLNATILTGARSTFALARDHRLFAPLGRWSARAGAPRAALVLQAIVALVLVGLGGMTRQGFETMVEYVSPVFWLFFLLTGFALFMFRWRGTAAPSRFRVPGYPVTPALFCASCAYLLYASLNYTGTGALVGVAVVAAGIPALLLSRRLERSGPPPASRSSDNATPTEE